MLRPLDPAERLGVESATMVQLIHIFHYRLGLLERRVHQRSELVDPIGVGDGIYRDDCPESREYDASGGTKLFNSRFS